MLKLNQEYKEPLLLVAFALFMHEVLTPVTMGLVLAGSFSIFIKLRLTRRVRNGLAIAVLVSYWFSYGKVIDPEVGINFLTTVIVLKLMEKESTRDRFMIFFGLLLLISAGALFERTLSYVLFFGASFLILIRDFYENQGQKAGLKDLGILLLSILPLTFGLFLFVPRIMNPVPFKRGAPGPGEIGYTPTVNFSSVESLTSNEDPAFHALVSEQVRQGELYWRGNTISMSDGWNWSLRPEDRQDKWIQNTSAIAPVGFKQSIRLFNKEDFLFSLDRPVEFVIRDSHYLPSGPITIIQDQRRWIQRYEVISNRSAIQHDDQYASYLRTGLKKDELKWIENQFKGKDPKSLETEIRSYFVSQKFEYNLRPGLVQSFGQFMRDKKTGFCSHFSSAVALVMRAKNIPARLVSGYMGGNFNPFGQFYLVSQNDAHVWVEVLDNNQWKRLDPTEWVAPDRVNLGGEAFMAEAQGGIFAKINLRQFSFLNDIKLWFGQWDFRFYQWLEQVDYHGQEASLSRFKIKREWFYFIAPLLLLFFTAIYAWQFGRRVLKKDQSELDRHWVMFQRKLKKRGLHLPLKSVQEGEGYLLNLIHPEKTEILEIWNLLIRQSFASATFTDDLRQKLKRF